MVGLGVTREEFGRFCDFNGFVRPSFWFEKTRNLPWTGRKEGQLREWLKIRSAGPKTKPKQAYFRDATNEFPNLPKKAFDRCWAETVPPSWKQTGRVIRRPRSE